jgi:hypothetical protein
MKTDINYHDLKLDHQVTTQRVQTCATITIVSKKKKD